MKELIEYIAKSLASQPEDVVVTEEVEGDRVILRLEVAEEDKGKNYRQAGSCSPGYESAPPSVGGQERCTRAVPGNSLKPALIDSGPFGGY